MVQFIERITKGGPPLSTPSQLGFRMPAEWEPHDGTWLTWPRAEGISFPGLYDHIPPVFATIVRILSAGEGVYINVWDSAMEQDVRSVLQAHDALNSNVEFFHHQAYEPWCRDHGPLFIKNKTTRAITNWGYNAWGEKYPPFDLDNLIPEKIARQRHLECFTPQMILEGGSIEINGTGTLLATESCLLNPNRNPALSKTEIENRLCDYLGVTNIIWLKEGVSSDDTDGHIDNLTRFVDPQTVVTVVEEVSTDENYDLLQENLRQLREAKTEKGTALRIIELPMPGLVEHEGERLPASYANFYIGNSSVLLPTYNHPNDLVAKNILQNCFPDREIINIDSTHLAWGLGSFHCLTQQEPA